MAEIADRAGEVERRQTDPIQIGDYIIMRAADRIDCHDIAKYLADKNNGGVPIHVSRYFFTRQDKHIERVTHAHPLRHGVAIESQMISRRGLYMFLLDLGVRDYALCHAAGIEPPPTRNVDYMDTLYARFGDLQYVSPFTIDGVVYDRYYPTRGVAFVDEANATTPTYNYGSVSRKADIDCFVININNYRDLRYA
jgi:hypothetical protein